MGDFDASFQTELARLSWSLYAVGMLLILMRMYARIHRLGVRRLQPDDYLMALAGCLYTALIVCLNVIAGGGGSNLFEPEEFDTFTPQEIQDRIHGSKIVIISEQAMLNVIYTIKGCMLIMYTRLTLGHQVQRMVTLLSIYVLCGWVATEIAFFTSCRPFSGYWAMPPPDAQCSTLQNYAIVQACFNISSDTLMLFIPLPLVTRLAVPWKQKVVLLLIFSMGIFVILAAILTKVFNLSDIFDPSYMLWYTRESSVAIYVSNLPMIWPLLREWFPFLRSLSPAPKTVTPNKSYVLTKSGMLKRLSKVTANGPYNKQSSHSNGVITTINAKTDSVEELTRNADEVDANQRTRFWDEESAPGTAGPLDSPGMSGWQDKNIHALTTVDVYEEHVMTDRTSETRLAKARYPDAKIG